MSRECRIAGYREEVDDHEGAEWWHFHCSGGDCECGCHVVKSSHCAAADEHEVNDEYEDAVGCHKACVLDECECVCHEPPLTDAEVEVGTAFYQELAVLLGDGWTRNLQERAARAAAGGGARGLGRRRGGA